MLQKLTIKNYALIEEIEIDFDAGFSIITGETGSGKSIIMGALGLLLGGRSDSKAIADKTKKTVIEAIFRNEKSGEETIIRREINPAGKSRAFIDDSPVTLQNLSDTTTRLLDIHSQHSNLILNTKGGQLEIIDSISDSEELLKDYQLTFRKYLGVRTELRKIRDEIKKNEEKKSFIEYQLAELKKINPRKGELAEVERKFELLSDADEIREKLSQAYQCLNGNEISSIQLIKTAQNELEQIETRNIEEDVPEEEKLIARLQNVYVELKDISETIDGFLESIESNPALLASTGTRMRTLLEAVKRFKVNDGDELAELKDKLSAQLLRLEGNDATTRELEEKGRKLAKELKDKAEALSEKRKKGSMEFSRKLVALTKPLGLPNLRFEVEILPGKMSSTGSDVIEFKCSFNKNGELLPIANTASGGELSRLTLGIKSLMAEKMSMPTIIFDEIDTGVSGEIADKMGRLMKEMASTMQVITITHLPQVASQGANQYKVYKRDTDQKTITSIKKLSAEERTLEIAAMLSGETLTESGIKAAEELLSRSDNK